MFDFPSKFKRDQEAGHVFEAASSVALRLTIAFALIGTGGVFLLAQTGADVMRGSWWVIYLLAPAIGSLVGAWVAYQRTERNNVWTTSFGAFSGILLILSLIFIFDPTWSFTRNLNFTLFDNVNWNAIWPIVIILFGVALLIVDFRRKDR